MIPRIPEPTWTGVGSGFPNWACKKMSATSQETARITAAIENWKRKLLDISKRNRALNFRPNKVTTITILDEQPAEVFRQLYIRGKSMRFGAAPEQALVREEPADSPVSDENEA